MRLETISSFAKNSSILGQASDELSSRALEIARRLLRVVLARLASGLTLKKLAAEMDELS
jgi:hypothetical protein